MSHAKAIGRVSILAVGLGIGIGVATAGTAAAAPTVPVDPFPVIPDLAVPAPSIPGLDLAISVDGFTLFQSGTAEAESGTGDIAIAWGSKSEAVAGTDGGGPGMFDTAMSFGNGTQTFSGDGNFDNAIAADGGFAEAGGDTPTVTGNNDFAYDLGPAPHEHTGALAGWVGDDSTGSNDIAAIFDPFGTAGSFASAGDGNYDLSLVFGDALSSTAATGGNFLVDILP